jgi:hypothetical protein
VAGQQNVTIAEGLGVSRPTVQPWRKRVYEQGLGEVWKIAPGRGRAGVAEEASPLVCRFVPTSSSWLNLVERWFRELTEKAIRRGSFMSVPDLKRAIEAFLQAWNQSPKPFIWSATVEDIIKKIDRARVKMEQIKPGSTQPREKKKPIAGRVVH